MPPLRNRVGVTFTDAEFYDVNEVARLLGTKPTKVVYECVRRSLGQVLEDGEKRRQAVEAVKALRSQVDWTADDGGFLGKKK